MEFLKFSELQVLFHTKREKLLSFFQENDVDISNGVNSGTEAIDEEISRMVDCLENARFQEIFQNEYIRGILGNSSGDKWYVTVANSAEAFLSSSRNSQDEQCRQVIVLFIGVAALQCFVQLNWIGPLMDIDLSLEIAKEDLVAEECMNMLKFCNQSVYPLIRAPELLLLAKLILHDCEINTLTRAWWRVRYLSVHQAVLQDKNTAVYHHILDAINEAKDSSICSLPNLSIQLKIEVALICLRFHDITKAKTYFKAVQEESGLSVNLSGALGNRTQFQTIPYSQLFLKTEKEKAFMSSLYSDNSDIPVDVKLQDDTLLNNIKFVSEEKNDDMPLLVAEDQLIILALSMLTQKQSAHDELLVEELQAYADSILKYPRNFCIQFCALILRCKLEKQRLKKVERAMLQLQALFDETKKNSEKSCYRFQLFYSTPMPPTWVVEKELANVLLSLGSVKSALDIFLRLEMWEECVFCYKTLQRNDKALQIIEAQLEKGKTPLLLCLKGDVTNEPSWYEEAWELSDHHCARAKRSLGYYYFQRKEYSNCIPHLLESVEIDSLEQRAWFFLGHAATQIENYELAARCYRSLINLDQDSFEAWNNLSNAYIKLNDKLRAWRTLQEALKCNYEEWKVWENYLLVSVDIGAFEEAINAWHRLIEIKSKHIDDEVLSILVKAVVQNLNDNNGKPAGCLLEKTLKLMGHITATDTTSYKTWASYATLLEHKVTESGNTELLDRVIQYHHKSWNILKSGIQANVSQKSASNFKALLDCSCNLVEMHLKRYASRDNEVQAKQQLHSAKLMARNTISLAEQTVGHFTDSEVNDIISPSIADLEDKLSAVMNILQ